MNTFPNFNVDFGLEKAVDIEMSNCIDWKIEVLLIVKNLLKLC